MSLYCLFDQVERTEISYHFRSNKMTRGLGTLVNAIRELSKYMSTNFVSDIAWYAPQRGLIECRLEMMFA